jgi:hypothetical protein
MEKNIPSFLSHMKMHRRGDRPPSPEKIEMWSIWHMWRDKEFLSLISKKLEWESPPNILITRNPNWSQILGTETSCVKGRY